MKCPFCGQMENRVTDSRIWKEGEGIRRRRECIHCGKRFTTFEYIEAVPLMIVKKDGRREPYSRDKVRHGILKACEKRNISMDVIDDFLDALERDIRGTGKKEVSTSHIGETIMARLHDLDDIAYVRFASVYREFKDVNDFVEELKIILSNQHNGSPIR
ncbi:MAG: transcriptional regulator NrdR [Desulfatirhabdiaceae bacterium]